MKTQQLATRLHRNHPCVREPDNGSQRYVMPSEWEKGVCRRVAKLKSLRGEDHDAITREAESECDMCTGDDTKPEAGATATSRKPRNTTEGRQPAEARRGKEQTVPRCLCREHGLLTP